MDAIIEVQILLDMLKKETHIQTIEYDDRTSGVHIKVDRNPQKPKTKEVDREDKSFL